MRRRIAAVALAALAAPGALAVPAAAQPEREELDVRVFATIGAPGHPEGVAADDDGTIYVGTHMGGDDHLGLGTGAPEPSKMFAFNPHGKLVRTYTIEGQRGASHEILRMAFDADGVLYIADRTPARIITLDPETGEQRDYASFRDVAPCGLDGPDGSCSATVSDRGPLPVRPVFAADGTMYVTDGAQALIWRVPPGGGEAELWFTDAELEDELLGIGPDGLQFLADGRTLLLNRLGANLGTAGSAGRLYELPVRDDGSPGELEVFWEARPGDYPDDFAIAASGNVYVTLSGANELVKLSAAGEVLRRVPPTPLHNQLQPIPFDNPAGVEFDGERLVVTNQSFVLSDPASWAVFDVYAGEPGLPLSRPVIGAQDAPRSPE